MAPLRCLCFWLSSGVKRRCHCRRGSPHPPPPIMPHADPPITHRLCTQEGWAHGRVAPVNEVEDDWGTYTRRRFNSFNPLLIHFKGGIWCELEWLQSARLSRSSPERGHVLFTSFTFPILNFNQIRNHWCWTWWKQCWFKIKQPSISPVLKTSSSFKIIHTKQTPLIWQRNVWQDQKSTITLRLCWGVQPEWLMGSKWGCTCSNSFLKPLC